MLKTHSSPSYKQIIAAGGQRQRRANDLMALLLFIIYNFVCIIASVLTFACNPFSYFRISPEFSKYKDAFGFWQLSGNWQKAFEGLHFGKVVLREPSLEIGYYRGDISSLHFGNKKFNFGSEYVYPIGINGAREYGMWPIVYCDEMTQMAVKNDTFKTICLVHVIDHVNGPKPVIKELSRIVKKGGVIYFSGVSSQFCDPDLKYIWRKLYSKDLSEKYKSRVSDIRKSWNYLTEEEWRELLEKFGLKMTNFRYIGERGIYSFVRYFLHFGLFHRGCFENEFFKSSALRPLFKSIFNFYYLVIGYPVFIRNKKRTNSGGCDFFVSAEKPL